MKNDTAVPKTIPVHCHMGTMKKMEIDFCYTVHPDDHIYAATKNEIKVSVFENGQKTELPNGVRVYENEIGIIKIKPFV